MFKRLYVVPKRFKLNTVKKKKCIKKQTNKKKHACHTPTLDMYDQAWIGPLLLNSNTIDKPQSFTKE